jgi:Flp pilus assembly protein TadD
MRQARWLAGLVFCLIGCTNAAQERVRVYNADGISLFAKGDYGDARDSFKAALALTPNDAGLLYNLAQCYDRMGDAAKAESYYNQCLQAAPGNADCRHALNVLLVNAGRQAEAADRVADWLAHEPKRAAAHAEEAWLLHFHGDLPQAQARLQKALELDPHDPRALTEMALVYEDLHRPDRAVALYQRLLARDPTQTAIAWHVNFLLVKGAGKPRPE